MQPYEKENKEFRKKWENLKDKINVHNPSIIDRIRVSNFLKDPRGIITARNGVAIFSEDTVVFYKDYDGDSIVDVYHRIDGKTRKILIEKSLWFEGVTAYLPDFPKEARFMERPFQHRIDRDYHQARKEGIYLPCIVLD
jgi:hypothetical protein